MVNQESKDILLILFGYCFGLGFTVLVALTFYFAFFHGFSTIVAVNDFNEAYLEFLLIPALIIVEVVGAILLFRALLKMARNPSQRDTVRP